MVSCYPCLSYFPKCHISAILHQPPYLSKYIVYISFSGVVFAGPDAFFFFAGLLFFGVGEMAIAVFVFVGIHRVTFVILGHICFFAVELARCVVVAAIRAGLIAGGVGVPEAGDWVGGRSAKG